MSKGKKDLNTAVSAQTELFDREVSEGMFNIRQGFRQCLSDEIGKWTKRTGKSRYQLAATVSELIGPDQELSKDMLDKYTSNNPDYRIPAEILTAVCYVIESLKPFQYLLAPLDSDVLNPEDRDLIELARLQEKRKIIDAQIQQISTRRGFK